MIQMGEVMDGCDLSHQMFHLLVNCVEQDIPHEISLIILYKRSGDGSVKKHDKLTCDVHVVSLAVEMELPMRWKEKSVMMVTEFQVMDVICLV